MSVLDRLDDPLVRWYAYVTISGTPYVIASQDLPAGWLAAPYVCIPALDVSKGIATDQSPMERRAGVATQRGMSLRIGPRLAPILRKYLSPEAASWRSRLDADFVYSENANLECVVAGGPTPTDWVYVGNEAVKVTGTDPNGYTLTAVCRAQLGSVRGDFGSETTKYVTDQPEIFEGRIVHVWIGLADAAGTPLDSALYGANQWEVFAGKVKSLEPGEDFETWGLSISSLEACLDLSIGAEDARGHLHSYASDSAAQGGIDFMSAIQGRFVYPGLNKVSISASDSGAAATVVVSVPTGFHPDVAAVVAEAIQTQLNAAPVGWAGTWSCVYTLMPWPTNDAEGDALGYVAYSVLRIQNNDAVGPATAAIIEAPGGVLPYLGWMTSTASSTTQSAVPGLYVYQWTWTSQIYAVYLDAHASEMLVILDDPDKWTPPGYVRIGEGEDAEVAAFSAISAVFTGSLYKLTLSKRGALGTVPRDAFLAYNEAMEAPGAEEGSGLAWFESTQQIQVQLLAGAETDIFSLILSASMSTGTPAIRGAYDIAGIPKGYGGALNEDFFDIPSFVEAEVVTRTLLTDRALSWQQPTDLKAWISQELAFLGYTLQARRLNTGRFKLTLDQVRDPLMVSALTLGNDDIAHGGKVKLKRVGQAIVNTAAAQVLYDCADESFRGKPWMVNHRDSQERYGKTPAASYQAKGLASTIAQSRLAVETTILGIMSRYGRPYEILTVPTKRALWVYQPGDQIAVTLPMLNARDGSRGWTDEPCIVLSVASRYVGKGKSPAATLRLIHLPGRRMSYYVPSGEVVGWHAASNTLTLAPNAHSGADVPFPPDPTVDCQDVRWFAEVGSKILICDEGDEANQELLTISFVDIAANTVKVTGPPVLVPGVDTKIYYPAYDDCTATQKLYVHLADAAGTLGAAGDEAQEYMG
jgi:hypothetical protein